MTCFARQNMDFILIMLCAKMASSVSDLDDIAIALCLFYCQRTQNLTSLSTSTASLITITWHPIPSKQNATAQQTERLYRLFQLLELFDTTIQAMAMQQLKTTIHTSRPMLQAKKTKIKSAVLGAELLESGEGFHHLWLPLEYLTMAWTFQLSIGNTIIVLIPQQLYY